jgi:hypothetical protein
MKKLFLILVIIISGFTQARGQVLISIIFGDKLNGPNLEFGLNAGANLSTLSNVENAKYKSDFGIGMYFTWKFHENWQLQPELFFRFPGGARKLPPYDIYNPVLDSLIENSQVIRKSNYFSIPIHIKYRIWKELRISFAPQISYMTKNNDFFMHSMEDDDLIYHRESRKHLNRWDFGLSAGLSYKLKQGKGVNLEARYYYGFADSDNKIPGESLKNRSICLYVGIPIGAVKEEEKEPSKE